jgi:predicted metal-dependent hydrolase
MIDWLRGPRDDALVEVAGQMLPVAIRRHARAKQLTMRLAPDGSEVRVTMPAWGRTRDALDFARSRDEWLARQLARVPQALTVAPGMFLPYRGRQLLVDWQAHAPRKPAIHPDNRVLLGGPQDNMSARLRRWLESEAMALMAQDLAFYCARAGQVAPTLRLSRAQRRWGSCSSERKGERCVRINWRLVMAPDHVRRSVVAHEVAHLQHFDHSPAFHALLARLFGDDLTAADRWLKQHGRSLYAAFG